MQNTVSTICTIHVLTKVTAGKYMLPLENTEKQLGADTMKEEDA